jgi:hypothetical protein
MVISVTLALHGQVFESARISGNSYRFVFLKWTKRFFKKNPQEDAGTFNFKVYILNWVHSKNWRKTFVVTLWPLLYLLLGNS